MELSTKTVVNKPEVSGVENVKKILDGDGRIPTIAFLHRTSNVDGQIAASVLGNYFDLAVAAWNVDTGNLDDRIVGLGMKIAGKDNFYRISVTRNSEHQAQHDDEGYPLEMKELQALSDAVGTRNKVPLIAAQRRGFDGILYRSSGLGAPLVAQLSGQHLILPVFVDIDYNRVKQGLVDIPATATRNLLLHNKPNSEVIVDEPIELDAVPREQIEIAMKWLMYRTRYQRPGESQEDMTAEFSQEEREIAKNTFGILKKQGDQIIITLGKHLPPERQGIWRRKIAEAAG